MDTVIQDDFAEFVENETLFNCEINLYNAQGGTLQYSGQGIYDKKPQLVETETGEMTYQGHKSVIAIPNYMSPLYSSIKGYFIQITDNTGLKSYNIVNSHFSSNVNLIYCELKEI